MNEERKWIVINPAAEEGAEAQKKVITSGYLKAHSPETDEGVGDTEIEYAPAGFWMSEVTHLNERYQALILPGAGVHMISGEPRVVQEGLYVAIPPHGEVTGVWASGIEEREILLEHRILPVAKEKISMRRVKIYPNTGIYRCNEYFPGKQVEYLDTITIGGRRVAHIMVYPLQVLPKENRARLLSRLKITVRYKYKGAAAFERKRMLPHPVDPLILDTESVLTGEELLRPPVDRERIKPQYLIIAPDEFVPPLLHYADIRSPDYDITIVTLREIYRKYPCISRARRIHRYIQSRYRKSESLLRYVLLAGDVRRIPVMYVKFRKEGGYDNRIPGYKIASDYAYSLMETSGADEYSPDLIISRLPASNAGELSKMLDLALDYRATEEKWRRRYLFTAYEKYNSTAREPVITAGFQALTNLLAALVPSGVKAVKRYPEEYNREDLVTAVSAGCGILNYRGHGWVDRWFSGNGLRNRDLAAIRNEGKPPLLFTLACGNLCLDCGQGITRWVAFFGALVHNLRNKTDLPLFYRSCFGEKWLKEQKAVGVVGSTRESYTDMNDSFNRSLIQFLSRERQTIGELFLSALTSLIKNYRLRRDYAAELYEYVYMTLLLGDGTVAL